MCGGNPNCPSHGRARTIRPTRYIPIPVPAQPNVQPLQPVVPLTPVSQQVVKPKVTPTIQPIQQPPGPTPMVPEQPPGPIPMNPAPISNQAGLRVQPPILPSYFDDSWKTEKYSRYSSLTLYNDMKALAERNNCVLLTQRYFGSESKMQYCCILGHIFERTPKECKSNGGIKRLCRACVDGKPPNNIRPQETVTDPVARLEELQAIAIDYGGVLNDTEYRGEAAFYSLSCSRGHKYELQPNMFRVISCCQRCLIAPQTRNFDDITVLQKYAEERGGKLISTTYTTSAAHYEWECEDGHRWNAQWSSVKCGESWCKACLGKVRHTIEMLREFAKTKGGRLLSETYVNAKTKYKWECEEGHTWETTWDLIHKGTWCPHCVGNARHTIKMLQDFAESKGGQLLLSTYIGSGYYYLWKCKDGHTWWATWRDVNRSDGRWCMDCSGSKKLTTELMHQLAAEKGGKFLSEEYIGGTVTYKWSCSKNHIFKRPYSSVRLGRWCRHCKPRDSGPELLLQSIFAKHQLFYVKQHTCDAVGDKSYDAIVLYRGRWYLVEVDGKQHMKKIDLFFKEEEDFIRAQLRDRFKTFAAWIMNVTLIRIAYSDFDKMEEKLFEGFNSTNAVYYSNPEMYKYISETPLGIEEIRYHSPEILAEYLAYYSQAVIPVGIPSVIGHTPGPYTPVDIDHRRLLECPAMP